MKKMATAAVTLILVGTLAACGNAPEPGPDGEYPDFDYEHRQACYTTTGVFKKYDDDCHDDKLLEKWERDLRFPRTAKTPGVRTPAGSVVKTPGAVNPGPVKPPAPVKPPTRPKR